MRKRNMAYENKFLLNVFNPEESEEPNIYGVYADKIWIENDRLYLRVIDELKDAIFEYFTKEDGFGENYFSIECDLSRYSENSSIMIEVESRFSFLDGHDALHSESNIQNNLKKKVDKKEGERKIFFKGVWISQFEGEILQEIEDRLLYYEFSLETKLEWNTRAGFTIEANRVSGISLHGFPRDTLPDAVSNLSRLKILNSTYSGLTSLPESIGNLKSLQEIELEGNHLTTLPKSIGNLQSLKTLGLSDNNLTSLPESITKLQSLKTLNLGNNYFSVIPDSITKLNSLQEINLSGLERLPESMVNMKSLKILYVSASFMDLKDKSILEELKKNGVKLNY